MDGLVAGERSIFGEAEISGREEAKKEKGRRRPDCKKEEANKEEEGWRKGREGGRGLGARGQLSLKRSTKLDSSPPSPMIQRANLFLK